MQGAYPRTRSQNRLRQPVRKQYWHEVEREGKFLCIFHRQLTLVVWPDWFLRRRFCSSYNRWIHRIPLISDVSLKWLSYGFRSCIPSAPGGPEQLLPGAKNVRSKVSSYHTPVVLGLAPVYWLRIPGNESEGPEVRASVYSYPVCRSLAMVLWGRAATYFPTSLPCRPSMLNTAICLKVAASTATMTAARTETFWKSMLNQGKVDYPGPPKKRPNERHSSSLMNAHSRSYRTSLLLLEACHRYAQPPNAPPFSPFSLTTNNDGPVTAPRGIRH